MRVFVFLFFILLCPFPVLSQTQNDLIDSYNKAFFAKDYESSLKPLEILLASEPQNIEFLRERAKIAGLQNSETDALSALKLLRESGNPKALPFFFDVLKSDFIPKEIKEKTKEYFAQQNDFVVLQQWDEKVLGVVKVSQVIVGTNPSSQVIPPSTVQQSTAIPNKIPICYVSRTGKKYHKTSICSKSKGSSLIPIFDLVELKKRTDGPCSNCWTGPEL